jgi:hypothetical protein
VDLVHPHNGKIFRANVLTTDDVCDLFKGMGNRKFQEALGFYIIQASFAIGTRSARLQRPGLTR